METVKLGKVVRLHGIVGEMKIQTQFDSDFDVKKLDYLYDSEGTTFKIKRAFKHDGGIIVGLEGVGLEKAKLMITKDMFISRDQVKGKILVEDIKGSKVLVDKKEIGVVSDVQNFGSAEVIYVKREGNKELLFPNVSGIIKRFDLNSKTVLLDENKLKEVSDYED